MTIYNSSISSFTGNVIIKFSAYSSSSGTVTFNITGETIQNYHTVKNSTCQTTVSGGSNALTTTSVSSGTIYTASIPSGVDKYFSFNSSSSKIYSVIWSGKIYFGMMYIKVLEILTLPLRLMIIIVQLAML